MYKHIIATGHYENDWRGWKNCMRRRWVAQEEGCDLDLVIMPEWYYSSGTLPEGANIARLKNAGFKIHDDNTISLRVRRYPEPVTIFVADNEKDAARRR